MQSNERCLTPDDLPEEFKKELSDLMAFHRKENTNLMKTIFGDKAKPAASNGRDGLLIEATASGVPVLVATTKFAFANLAHSPLQKLAAACLSNCDPSDMDDSKVNAAFDEFKGLVDVIMSKAMEESFHNHFQLAAAAQQTSN